METTNKPQIIILIGPSGCGKSTFAEEFIRNNPSYIYLNPDTMRGVIGKDNSDQTVNNEVFSVMGKMGIYFAKLGNNMLVDATNYNKSNRKLWLRIAKDYHYECVGVTFDTDLATCLIRNETREYRVPLWVVHKMFDNYEKPTIEEGFNWVVNSEDYVQAQTDEFIREVTTSSFDKWEREQDEFKAKLGQ